MYNSRLSILRYPLFIAKWMRRRSISLIVASFLAIGYWFLVPSTLFNVSYSTVLQDRKGNLLNASIASDGQWRFPVEAEVPEKFIAAITLFEDKRFFYHPGVDPFSTGRALWQNIQAGQVVSGGSTLTMQVVRLSRQNPSRTFLEKFFEMLLATRLEVSYSKKEILALYSAHAPFGGNVVGLEAACWRYFGRPPDALSWAEASLLAVLPNNPSLINLSSNRILLKEKRDRLLRRLHRAEAINDLTLELALAEELPERPQAMPRISPHLLDRAMSEGNRERKIVSAVEVELQKRVTDILRDHSARLSGNQIFNAASLVLKVETGEVLAYVGNVPSGVNHQESVDVIKSPRSTGSILKPFLYAAMQNEGQQLPTTLVPDIPTIINGFSPKNFSREYDGSVPADKALIRSLNIPAVHELREFRYEKFYSLLNEIGITTLTQPADHYGLSLILGGAEGTLWDITGAYASMARTLNHYFQHSGSDRYNKSDFHAPSYLLDHASPMDTAARGTSSHLSAASIWLTFEVLKEVYRPGEETGWKHFQSAKKIAWKTGTSFGFRDGWAIGVNPEFAVGVWVGNADGEGRPGLTGTETAAPILFDIFSQLPGNSWFEQPRSEMLEMSICTESGLRATELCSGEKKSANRAQP
jgi:penicillin-binding protein 1C